jgi:hypothetical protein
VNRLVLFVDSTPRRAENAMATVDVAPVADALAGAAEERQNRLVAPRGGGDETLDQPRIKARGKASRDAGGEALDGVLARVDRDR